LIKDRAWDAVAADKDKARAEKEDKAEDKYLPVCL
jgi:hypothetical protein